VVLLDDCWTRWNVPEVGIAAVRLLEAAGYRVELAGLACCGRPAFSKGLLDVARDLAAENVRRLAPIAAEGVPILGLEPSCLTVFLDEYRELRLGGDAGVVAAACRMADAFLADREKVPELPLRDAGPGRVLLHGHCQQKAIVGTAGTVAALRRIPGVEVRELDAGCCGMAGSFGYERSHREVSAALARRVLLPAVEREPDAVLVAPGFSCRSQVKDLGGVRARHPVELLAERLEGA
jgi:Fe-S oxidoreductase